MLFDNDMFLYDICYHFYTMSEIIEFYEIFL